MANLMEAKEAAARARVIGYHVYFALEALKAYRQGCREITVRSDVDIKKILTGKKIA